MDVSSAGSTGSVSAQVEVMKKAQDVQAQQVLKTLESVNEQSKEITAQKTGVGKHVNIMG